MGSRFACDCCGDISDLDAERHNRPVRIGVLEKSPINENLDLKEEKEFEWCRACLNVFIDFNRKRASGELSRAVDLKIENKRLSEIVIRVIKDLKKTSESCVFILEAMETMKKEKS